MEKTVLPPLRPCTHTCIYSLSFNHFFHETFLKAKMEKKEEKKKHNVIEKCGPYMYIFYSWEIIYPFILFNFIYIGFVYADTPNKPGAAVLHTYNIRIQLSCTHKCNYL